MCWRAAAFIEGSLTRTCGVGADRLPRLHPREKRSARSAVRDPPPGCQSLVRATGRRGSHLQFLPCLVPHPVPNPRPRRRGRPDDTHRMPGGSCCGIASGSGALRAVSELWPQCDGGRAAARLCHHSRVHRTLISIASPSQLPTAMRRNRGYQRANT